MGGPQPYIPVGLEEKVDVAESAVQNPQKRARVLCSYDAADATELNLTGNEVSKSLLPKEFCKLYSWQMDENAHWKNEKFLNSVEFSVKVY